MRLCTLWLVLLSTSGGGQRPAVWRLTPELRIGADKGAHYEFTRVFSILPASDGSIYVVDSDAQAIRVFDAKGSYLRTIGRKGGGPGEFNALASIGFLGDTLWATDAGLRRVSLFSADGTLLSTIPLEVPEPGKPPNTYFVASQVNVVLAGGMALGRASHSASSVAAGKVPASPILLMSRGGRAIDTVAWLSTKNSQMAFAAGKMQLFAIQRFSDTPLAVMAAAARVFVIDRSVATSRRNAVFRVTALGVKRDTVWQRSYAYEPKRLERASVDSVLSSYERSWARMGLTRDQIRAQMFIPEFRTPVSAGLATPDGSLWLKREDGSTTVDYSVIGPTGLLQATLTLPRHVTLRAVVGNTAWGVETDADDVPSIVRYRIDR